MKTRVGLVAAALTLVMGVTAASAGVLPPEDSDWQDGVNVVSTPKEEGDADETAQEAFFSVFITKCGSDAPFDPEGSVAVTSAGTFSFNEKLANLAGQTYKLKVKAEWVSTSKIIEKVTISKGKKCKKTKTFTLNEF